MRVILVALLLALTVLPAQAEGERAGDFDYYLLALSWSPNWCRLVGDAGSAPECRTGAGRTFTLHGLWPQNETGWPSHCHTAERDPSRQESAEMADIMGSSALAWYQWTKHGRCTGLSARAYYAAMRGAFAAIILPEVFARLDHGLNLPAQVVEDAFLEANPGLTRDQITVTCTDGMIREVRLCLTRDLRPRRCGADTIRDCRLKDALLAAPR